ncbi:hypothetical protein DFH11DRAFT_471442 [Phellopilus nigrolimitatus]|nr:hypothetical protein DFH11DRAFT_471442 [Phellopilus nigrolimitatus]
MALTRRTGSLPIGVRPCENVPPQSDTRNPSTSRTVSEGQLQANRDMLTVIDFSKYPQRHPPSTKSVSRTNNTSVRNRPPSSAKEPSKTEYSVLSKNTASRSSASRSVDLNTPPAGWRARIKYSKEERRKREQQSSEDEETRMEILKSRIAVIVESSMDYGNKIGKQSLEFAAVATRLAPFTFIAAAAQSLLWMVDMLQFVQTNKDSCVSLIGRCGDAFLTFREIVESGGEHVEGHVQDGFKRVRDIFKEVEQALLKQKHRPYIERLIKRKDINDELSGCSSKLDRALKEFETRVLVRILALTIENSTRRLEIKTALEELLKSHLEAAISAVLLVQLDSGVKDEVAQLTSKWDADKEETLKSVHDINRQGQRHSTLAAKAVGSDEKKYVDASTQTSQEDLQQTPNAHSSDGITPEEKKRIKERVLSMKDQFVAEHKETACQIDLEQGKRLYTEFQKLLGQAEDPNTMNKSNSAGYPFPITAT